MTPNDPATSALIDPREWGLEMTKNLNKIKMVFQEIETYKQGQSYEYLGAYCGFFIDNSQMAAEHLVKIMLKRRKVTPARTHNIERLAHQMRLQRPDDVSKSDWSALAVRIEALNGHSHRDHQVGYGEFELSTEDIMRSATRVSKTFLLLVDEVESVLYPRDVSSAMGVSATIIGDDSYQALMRMNADDVCANCVRIVSQARAVHNLADTPKTFRTAPIEPVRSFLSLLSPIETIISPQMTARLTTLISREGHDDTNPFEMDASTTKAPSPFDS
ncbi:MAG: hypothetical protein OXC62_15085 [Aestuariivita sp.]|nr:hypothetical protein [Aestuariivita sp.]